MRILAIFILISNFIFASSLITGQNIKFQRGNKILYQNDFSKCPVGELPSGFDKIQGGFECVKFKNHIYVAKSAGNHSYLIKNIKLPKEFAIEFDTVYHQNDNFLVLKSFIDVLR